jgi:hypothetical protein
MVDAIKKKIMKIQADVKVRRTDPALGLFFNQRQLATSAEPAKRQPSPSNPKSL